MQSISDNKVTVSGATLSLPKTAPIFMKFDPGLAVEEFLSKIPLSYVQSVTLTMLTTGGIHTLRGE